MLIHYNIDTVRKYQLDYLADCAESDEGGSGFILWWNSAWFGFLYDLTPLTTL